jgi:hypothetical protein
LIHFGARASGFEKLLTYSELPSNRTIAAWYMTHGGRDSLHAERSGVMSERTWWETIKVEGSDLLDKFKKLIHEGNVRRIIIKQSGRSIAEFPLTVGVVGTVFAPILAAVGTLAALLTDCTLEVERVVDEATPPSPTAPAE